MSEHTEWTTHLDTEGDWRIRDTHHIATVAEEAKARLIVRAVNSHTALLDALEDGLFWLNDWDTHRASAYIKEEAQRAEYRSLMAKFKTAIKKAKE